MTTIVSTKTINHNNNTKCVRTVFTINNLIISGSDDCTIKIWDINSLECIKTLDLNNSVLSSMFVINNLIIGGLYDHTVKIWDINTYECIRTLHHDNFVCSVCATSKIIISGSVMEIKIWDIKTYACIKTLIHNYIVMSIIVVNNNIIGCTNVGTIIIWDINTYECINTLVHAPNVSSVFAINNIIMGGGHQSIKTWDIRTHECIGTIDHGYVTSIFANRDIIVTGSSCYIYRAVPNEMGERKGAGLIKIWDVRTHKCLNTISIPHDTSVLSIKIIDNKIISSLCNGTILINEYLFVTCKQIIVALMCMRKLDYPIEIIHEIFGWLKINTYAKSFAQYLDYSR
jgi:WD40 repeat protein